MKIVRLDKALPLPKYATVGSSGMDVYASRRQVILPGETHRIPLGFALEIPIGFEIQMRPRSGLASAFGITLLNTPGTIDCDYRGEISVLVYNTGKEAFIVSKGFKIAQMVLCPIAKAQLEEVDELPQTIRGAGGFGSTGM